MTNNKCIICGSKTIKYMDLGKSVPANAFVKKEALALKEQAFPLEVFYCKACHLAQLGYVVDRKTLFNRYNYISSASSPLKDYYRSYAQSLKQKFPKQSSGTIIDIGSNDGTLLKEFKKTAKKIIGVDPAKNIATLATKEGVPTLPLFFNIDTAKKIIKKYGKADIVTANHVLAHTDTVHDFISGVKLLLENDGIFIFEVQYVGDLIKKGLFDNTYHEHVSYFSLAPLITLLDTYELKIFDVEITDAQGGSIKVYSKHTFSKIPEKASVAKLLSKEKVQGLHKQKTYESFGKKPEKIKSELVTILKKLKKQGKTIVGYGAPAKGNTLLQYCGIGPETLDYIVDTTHTKQGKYTPGTHIPVYSPDMINKKAPDYILILTWNYADTIIKKESALQKKGVKFIIPMPTIKVV